MYCRFRLDRRRVEEAHMLLMCTSDIQSTLQHGQLKLTCLQCLIKSLQYTMMLLLDDMQVSDQFLQVYMYIFVNFERFTIKPAKAPYDTQS